MAHTICGIDVGAFSVKFAFLEVGFRTTTLRGLMETAVPAGEAPLLAAADGRRARGAGAGLGRGHALPGRPRRSAVGARARAAVLGFAQDRSGRRLRAGGPDRPRHRGRRVRSPGRRPAPRGRDGDGGGRPARGPGGAHRGRPRSTASTRARCSRRRSSTARCCRRAADATARRRPLPGGARLRPPAHQHLLRARGRSGLRAHHPARRRAADGGDREGVQRRSRARRAGQAQRRVPGQPGPAGDHAARREAGQRAARGAGADDPRAAPDAGQLPRQQPLRRRRAAGGGRRRPARRAAAVPRGRAGHSRALSVGPARAGIGRRALGRRRGRGGGRARIRLLRAGRRDRDRREPRLARDRLPPRARSSTARASRSCARRRGTSPRWRARCCSRAASTSAPGTRA